MVGIEARGVAAVCEVVRVRRTEGEVLSHEVRGTRGVMLARVELEIIPFLEVPDGVFPGLGTEGAFKHKGGGLGY